jgi:DNA-binding NarL/FixJ family response regulator
MDISLSCHEFNQGKQSFQQYGLTMSVTNAQLSTQQPYMRVLLVEDSALLRETIMETLSSCEGLVFDGVAATQSEAFKILRDRPFDLLLVDIELAEGNGFEVIRMTQREDFPYPRPKYMILTNHAHVHYQQEAKALGVEYFFDKSMDFDKAIDTLEREVKHFVPQHE